MAIVEERNYTIRVGGLQAYLKLYETEGYATHWKHLGPPIAWFSSEIGALNQVVMMWRYESHAEREIKRAALYSDPDWLAFIPKTAAYIEKMENRILVPTSFSPLK